VIRRGVARGGLRKIRQVDVPNRQVAEAFVELSDTTVTGFALPAYLHRLAGHSVDLLGIQAAGVLLRDRPDAPDKHTVQLDARVLQTQEGAAVDCLGTGVPVRCHDLTTAHARWPEYTRAAHSAGFRSVYAFPMQRRGRTVGTLEVFAASTVGLGDDDVALGQALADVAAIGILNERDARSQGVLIDQLQGALDSRVAIEQAKGVLAERFEIDMDTAFTAMRGYARSNGSRLLDVARTVISTPAVAAEVHARLRPHHSPPPPAPGQGGSAQHG
jgi:GAF domain-containing protein